MDDKPPFDSSGLAILSFEECLARLRSAPVGRVAFLSAGEPMVVPVNHGLDGASVVFRTAIGSKLFAADRGAGVAFEVDGHDAERRVGWSVLVRGVAETVEAPQDIARLETLGVRAWARGVDRPYWVRIRAAEVTGREIAEVEMTSGVQLAPTRRNAANASVDATRMH